MFVPVEINPLKIENIFFFAIQKKVEEAENIKLDLVLSKLTADEECDRAEKQLAELKEQERQCKDRMHGSEVWTRLRVFGGLGLGKLEEYSQLQWLDWSSAPHIFCCFSFSLKRGKECNKWNSFGGGT